MKKIVIICVAIVLAMLFILFLVNVSLYYQKAKPTSTLSIATSVSSKEADKVFVSTVVNSIDLNSGITMETTEPLYRFQSNNITFAVFNHTDETIIFPNQGFGLIVFRYDTIAHTWEKLQLNYIPYPEHKILPPKLEKWDFDIGNTWDILENDSTALGYSQVRLYISGQGKNTNKIYGAYLDVTISLQP
jgi:hypothetical protein